MSTVSESLLCTGMRDLLPEDMERFRRVERAFLEASRAWGYREVRTPALEHLYLFTSTGTLTPQLLGRVYSFLDWDGWTGERVVLRPDATIPVARLYRERLESGIAKLAYVTNIFRFSEGDDPREQWQCGAELIGDSWPQGDLELIVLAAAALRACGISHLGLTLSHTGIVRALLERAGFQPEEQSELYDRLLSGDRDIVADLQTRLPQLGSATQLLTDVESGTAGYLENLRAVFLREVPAMAEALDALALIERAASAIGLPVEISVTGARDFEYYTGVVFSLSAAGRILVSGGRYDRLISHSDGRFVPACGFALDVDHVMALIAGVSGAFQGVIDVRPASHAPEALGAAVVAAQQLQARGLSAGLVQGSERGRSTLVVDGSPAAPRFRLEDQSGRTVREGVGVDEVIEASAGAER